MLSEIISHFNDIEIRLRKLEQLFENFEQLKNELTGKAGQLKEAEELNLVVGDIWECRNGNVVRVKEVREKLCMVEPIKDKHSYFVHNNGRLLGQNYYYDSDYDLIRKVEK